MLTDEKLVELIKNHTSYSEVLRTINKTISSKNIKNLRGIAQKYKIDTSHFDLRIRQRKYPYIIKTCPVCKKDYRTQQHHPKEKIVCSKSCSNTFFRSGKNNPNFKPDKIRYREICFKYWEHKCAICDWNKIVDVHHIDNNHESNDILNLIPLCPNHHMLTITLNYKEEINKQIRDIISIKWNLIN